MFKTKYTCILCHFFSKKQNIYTIQFFFITVLILYLLCCTSNIKKNSNEKIWHILIKIMGIIIMIANNYQNVLYLTGYSEISHFLCEEFKILLKVVTLVFASTTGKRILPIKINKNYLDSCSARFIRCLGFWKN